MRRKSSMPQVRQEWAQPAGLQWDLMPHALERWAPDLSAASAAPTDNTISVLDPIGIDPWTGDGVTAKRIAAALRSIGPEADVVVNVNSPGGDLFEGMAIYNLLREHKGNVQVKVLGLAASAASLIAMAGDEVLVARAGFLMVHNTWVMAIGNRNDLRDVADKLEPFDAAMADIYAARSGIDAKKVSKMMDAETWINGSAAVEQGFADGLLAADAVKTDANAATDRIPGAILELALARAGMPRSARRQLMKEYRGGTPSAATPAGTPSATATGTPSAAAQTGQEYLAELRAFTLN